MEQRAGTVRLQAPGAGLPTWERWMLGALLLSASYRSKQQVLGIFLREADLILHCAERLDPVQGARRVLINRVLGMEDSSRNWSAYMVLEHLVIVDTAIGAMIRTLADGRALTREVRIQDVKPHAEAGPEQIDKFKRAVATYVDIIDTLPYLQTQVRHPHPWFGPLDGRGWHALAAFHHRIHRKQLQRIVAGLNSVD
jgi:hypothetical protein